MKPNCFTHFLAGAALMLASVATIAAPGTCTITPDLTVVDAGEPVTLTGQCTGTVSTVNWKDGATSLTGDITMSPAISGSTPFTFTTRALSGGSPVLSHTLNFVATDPAAANSTTSGSAVVAVRGGPTLAVTLSGDGGGTVNSSPGGISCTTGTCNSSFAFGSTVNLVPVPNSTSTFGGWSGDCAGTGACVIGIQGARAVTATFSAITDGNCGAAANVATATTPSSGLCTTGTPTSVASGTTSFTWQCTGGPGANTASCSAPRQYTATVTSGAAGPNGTVTPGSHTVTAGQPAAFTVTPAPGFSATMGGTCAGALSGNAYTVAAVTTDCTVTASFSNQPVNGQCGTPVASTTAPSSGLCTAGSASSVTSGTNTFTWSCNGSNGGTNATNCSSIRQYTASASSTGTGTISPSSRTVNGGATTTFTVTPGSGQGATMTGSCGGTLNGTTYTTSAVSTDCTVIATFAPQASPTSDPGMFTGFWAPPGTSNYIVADQMKPNGTGTVTYVPGCLNQLSSSNSSSGCAIQTSRTDVLAGGGNFTAALAADNTIAIRYKSKATLDPSFTRAFKVSSLNGSNVQYSSLTIWLSSTPGAGPETVDAKCRATSGAQPVINTHATDTSKCVPTPDTFYYLNIRPDVACSFSGSTCNLSVTESLNFD